jgi:protein ImuB
MSHSWLAIELPHLALNLVTRGQPVGSHIPVAISDTSKQRPQVLDSNPAALRLGVRPGLPVSAALALAEGLCLHARNSAAEAAALQSLAAWCYQYSSLVSIHASSSTLLLEAGASERLFGASNSLAGRLSAELLELGYHSRIGIGPAPASARLAARHGLALHNMEQLQAALDTLPLSALDLCAAQQSALNKMGFQKVRDILRLPRKSLARRLGPALVNYLDRLCGLCPDPQKAWQPPASWSSQLELAAETTSSRALLFPLKRMVQELCGNLRAGDFGVQQLHATLRLRHGEESFHIGLQQPGRDAQQLMLLLRERLERLRLPSPARQIKLEAARLLPFSATQQGLFADQQDASDSALTPLLERLRARLGSAAVYGLKGVQDHRPEYSWEPRRLDEQATCTPMPQRPLWLYQAPQPCRINDYQVLAGPERIESGWWDGRDCRRDYFIVQDQRGSTLWAYHEYKPSPGWYLHGVFA